MIACPQICWPERLFFAYPWQQERLRALGMLIPTGVFMTERDLECEAGRKLDLSVVEWF